MKNILFTVLTFVSLTLMAQVPQGVGYQGVATDSEGIELVNQSISIKASVLSGSANGTIEWEETHATSTDTFGLFTITIGQGTNTTNGIQADFTDISWGTNTYFLKIEMDVNGGANYAFMGTNQMMSVPYALYAESANINYDSISNLLSNDSTFITNVGGGMGGGIAMNLNSLKYPEGFSSEFINLYFAVLGYYVVPDGKTLYITNAHGNFNLGFLKINGITISSGLQNFYSNNDNPYVANENDTISAAHFNINGFLVEKNIDYITYNLGISNYIVPNNKLLIVTNFHTDVNNYFYVNDLPISAGKIGHDEFRGGAIYLLDSNDTLSSSSDEPYFDISFNGYLVDEDYFVDCGGGGGSTTNSSFQNDVYLECVDMGVGEFCPGLSPDATLLPQNNYSYQMDWSDWVDGSGNIPAPHWRKFQIHNLPADFTFIQFRFNGSSSSSNFNPLIDSEGNVYFYIYHNYESSCSNDLDNVIPMSYAVNTFQQAGAWNNVEIWYSRTNHLVDSGIRVDF